MSASVAVRGYNTATHELKIRWGDAAHANLLAVQAANTKLRARGTTKLFGLIVNIFFAATYNQNELLRLLGSTRVVEVRECRVVSLA